jgi:hypothetical protein
MWLGVGWRRTEGSERPLCHFGEGVILRRKAEGSRRLHRAQPRWVLLDPLRVLRRIARSRPGRDPSPLAQDDAFPSSPKGYL